jgi:hypothetical protein
MEKQTKTICPTCQGQKVIEGICQCSSEWRGTEDENGWEDCHCTPELECPACHGTGFEEPVK